MSETTEERVTKTPDWCPRCGSSVDFLDCDYCGGVGYVDLDEDYGDGEDAAPCTTCQGRGGTWHCISPPEWCLGNPLPGKEFLPSTALISEEWT